MSGFRMWIWRRTVWQTSPPARESSSWWWRTAGLSKWRDTSLFQPSNLPTSGVTRHISRYVWLTVLSDRDRSMQVYVMWLHLLFNTIIPFIILLSMNTAIYRKLVSVSTYKTSQRVKMIHIEFPQLPFTNSVRRSAEVRLRRREMRSEMRWESSEWSNLLFADWPESPCWSW